MHLSSAGMRRPSHTGRQELLNHHLAWVDRENAWQRRARLAQSLWRQRNGFEAGLHRGRRLGSRLVEADGFPPRMANYLTANVRAVVRHALRTRQAGALFAEPRLWTDLLSSQPLCFNLVGELTTDLDLAMRVFRSLFGDRVEAVDAIRFEWSPGRDDPRYTANRSAFDILVDYRGPRGRGFLAFEVKYHEDLKGTPATPRAKYCDIARQQGIFSESDFGRLERLPLQQLWLDHLLALQMLSADRYHWQDGLFVVLHPGRNRHCAEAVADYRGLLLSTETFDAITLETFVEALARETDRPWVADLRDRYVADGPLRATGWTDDGAAW